jgi:hypothetical protein
MRGTASDPCFESRQRSRGGCLRLPTGRRQRGLIQMTGSLAPIAGCPRRAQTSTNRTNADPWRLGSISLCRGLGASHRLSDLPGSNCAIRLGRLLDRHSRSGEGKVRRVTNQYKSARVQMTAIYAWAPPGVPRQRGASGSGGRDDFIGDIRNERCLLFCWRSLPR